MPQNCLFNFIYCYLGRLVVSEEHQNLRYCAALCMQFEYSSEFIYRRLTSREGEDSKIYIRNISPSSTNYRAPLVLFISSVMMKVCLLSFSRSADHCTGTLQGYTSSADQNLLSLTNNVLEDTIMNKPLFCEFLIRRWWQKLQVFEQPLAVLDLQNSWMKNETILSFDLSLHKSSRGPANCHRYPNPSLL